MKTNFPVEITSLCFLYRCLFRYWGITLGLLSGSFLLLGATPTVSLKKIPAPAFAYSSFEFTYETEEKRRKSIGSKQIAAISSAWQFSYQTEPHVRKIIRNKWLNRWTNNLYNRFIYFRYYSHFNTPSGFSTAKKRYDGANLRESNQAHYQSWGAIGVLSNTTLYFQQKTTPLVFQSTTPDNHPSLNSNFPQPLHFKQNAADSTSSMISNYQHIKTIEGTSSPFSKEKSHSRSFIFKNNILYSTFYFYMISSASLIAFLIKRQKRFSSKYALSKKKLAELELSVLQAQVNPHFLFNTLNSIQYLAFKNDIKNINYYFSRIATLMRMFLDSSSESFITLDKEIFQLRTYLELEALRFNEKFEYHIQINPELLLSDIFIPTMIIQPFVENAINHGLSKHKQDNCLEIQFDKDDDFLICQIQDNGIGRAKASKKRKQNQDEHKSRGMNIIFEKLERLNHQRNEKISIKIIDLTDPQGQAAGTKVIIKTPIYFVNKITLK